jgi:hypothetical protein
MSPHGPIIYLNNCQRRDYFAHYRWEDAFYDLNTVGRKRGRI